MLRVCGEGVGCVRRPHVYVVVVYAQLQERQQLCALPPFVPILPVCFAAPCCSHSNPRTSTPNTLTHTHIPSTPPPHHTPPHPPHTHHTTGSL